MSFRRSLLVLSAFATVQALAADADSLVQDTLDKHFPENAEALKVFNDDANHLAAEDKLKGCHFAPMKEVENTDSDGGLEGYCLRLVSEKVVDVAAGKRRYLLFAGDNLHTPHSAPGMIALFAFSSADGKDWQPATQYQGEGFGKYGIAPTEWQWQLFGKDVWGATTFTGDAAWGGSWSSQGILLDDGKAIHAAFVPSGFSNFSEEDGCEPEDLSQCADVQVKYAVREDLPAVGNVYPLELSLDGFIGMAKSGKGKNAKPKPVKTLKGEKFIWQFDADKHTYVEPKGFPKMSEE